MAAKRKTVTRVTVVENANRALRQSGTWQLTPEQRQAISTFTEGLLMDMNDYRGFGYLQSELQDDGTLRADHDDTRRIYF